MLTRYGVLGATHAASGQHFAFCMLATVLMLFCANAGSQDAPVLTAKLKFVCGQSDVIWEYIVSVMGPKQATVNDGNRGRQGESMRHFLLYPDNSWVLVYDFFLQGRPSEVDQACIVASGSHETAYESTNLLIMSFLTSGWVSD